MFATEMARKLLDLSVSFLAACNNYPVLKDSRLEENAFYLIKKNPQMLLELSSSQIERISNCRYIEVDEFFLFKILFAWADIKNETSTSDRKRKAKELTNCLSLESIETTHLSTTVALSGLVSTGQLYEAYKTQALHAKREHGISYKKSHHGFWRKPKCGMTSFMFYSQEMRPKP